MASPGPATRAARSPREDTSEDAEKRAYGLRRAGVRTILVCRATLGRMLYTDEKMPNVGDLERHCGYKQAQGKGHYDSVLGDREKCSGTYREFIVYDDDFVYPDFIVKYRRET